MRAADLSSYLRRIQCTSDLQLSPQFAKSQCSFPFENSKLNEV